VLGLEMFLPGHDRGSSHGQTRIIRRAYFEHPDYVPLVERAYARWHVLEDRSGQQFLYPVGLLQVGPPEGAVVRGTLASAAQHHRELEHLSAQKVERRFPGLKVPDGMVGLFEPGAGYLRVEDCVRAHVDNAIRAGAVVHAGEAVRSWHA